MSQFSWNIVEVLPADLAKARRATEKCNKELFHCIHSSQHKARILSQLDSFISSLQDIESNQSLESHFTNKLPCLYFVKALGIIQIHPSFLGNPHNGVYHYLSNYLMHYNEDFDGVWISCGNIRQLESLGYITADDPSGTISVRVSLRILTFIPRSDNIIIGKINRIRPHSISILVYGIFNATIKSEDIVDIIRYEEHVYKLLNQEKTLNVGNILSVKITNITILPKNQWLNLTTTIEEKELIVA